MDNFKFYEPKELFHTGMVYVGEFVHFQDVNDPRGRYIRLHFKLMSDKNTTEQLCCNAGVSNTNKNKLLTIIGVLSGGDKEKLQGGIKGLVGSICGVYVTFKKYGNGEIAVIEKVVPVPKYMTEPKPDTPPPPPQSDIDQLLFGKLA